ncbi:MAG: peptidase T [Bacteroidaceae bacterium]|nr:peptidase T [Bacteroidaceae bacterium]
MNIVERFLNYTKFDTQSAEDSQTTPSTEKQWAFARYLKGELEDIGLDDVELDEHGYLYAVLPANTNKKAPEIGFIAHMDTSPDCSGADINPRIVECYDGGDIVLDAEADIRISPQTFPELLSHKGEDIIVTDGHTLLGADDKAGIAEIVQAMVWLMEHPEIEHGNIHVAFNPDEEIGMGAHKFDVEKFGCEWAYTMDGSEVGELEFENFNAASAKIAVTGMSVHPGYAKGKMLNAGRIAAELVAMMPEAETPEQTEGYEGFFHLTGMSGNVERAELSYIIRDHDRKRFEQRKEQIVEVCNTLNEKYGSTVVKAEVKDQYYNMREKVEPMMHVIDIAIKAMERAGVPVKIQPIRGGTDGAQLSFKGLPCPNIFAGGMNFHGPLEYLPIPSMHKAMDTIVQICAITAKYNE